MQAATDKPPLALVYDANIGQSIDSILALALLHGFAGRQKCRIASLTVNYPDLRAAQLCEVIERFYASAVAPGSGGFVGTGPGTSTIGVVESKVQPADVPLIVKTVARTDDEGRKLWASRIKKWNDTAIPEVMIRNALTAQYDGNAAIVETGPATNLASVLKLTDAPGLIAAKVEVLVIAGGEFFTADPPAARRVLAEWPTPIVFCGRDVGDQLPFPGASIESAFAYNPEHPVAAAYRAAGQMPYDAPAPAMAAMLYAIRPADGYFTLSDPGTIALGNDGRTEFRPDPRGLHRYLKVDPAQRERISKMYVEMAGAKPVAPPSRFPPAPPPPPPEKK